MPLIGARGERTRVDLPAPGEWVEVKRHPSVGDKKAIQGMALAFTLRVNKQQIDAVRRAEAAKVAAELLDGVDLPVDADLFDRMAFARLERAIVAWSFEEPVTPESIRELDEASYDAIVAALDRLWGNERSDDEKNAQAGVVQLRAR